MLAGAGGSFYVTLFLKIFIFLYKGSIPGTGREVLGGSEIFFISLLALILFLGVTFPLGIPSLFSGSLVFI